MSELIGTRYPTRDELKASVQSYARKNGFAVKQSVNGQGVGILFKCSCEGNGNEDKLGEDRKRMKNSQRSGCKWKLTASLPKKAKEGEEDRLWEVRVLRLHSGHKFDTKNQGTPESISDENSNMVHHNHVLIKNNDSALCKVYSQYRKRSDTVINTLSSLNRNVPAQDIINTIAHTHNGFVMTPKDVYNFYQMTASTPGASTEFRPLLEFLQGEGYIVHYEVTRPGNTLKALFVIHPDSIMLARRFSEVTLIDSTYKVNFHNMPLVHIVGVCNLGSRQLRTFLIACCVMVDEKESSYTWMAKKLHDIVWPTSSIFSPPALFVTDQDPQLIKSIHSEFPSSDTIRCAWHVQKNFSDRYNGKFTPKKRGQKYSDQDKMDHIVSKLLWCRTEKEFDNAVECYYKHIPKSSIEAELKSYMASCLENKHVWGGYWCEQFPHFQSRTTSRVESYHKSLKARITKYGSLLHLFQKINEKRNWMMEDEDGELYLELLKQPVIISSDAAKYFENLLGRVSHYALYILRNEYINIDEDNHNDNCCCIVKQNLRLPCRHAMIKSDMPILLESVYSFWHIYEEEADVSIKIISKELSSRATTILYTLQERFIQIYDHQRLNLLMDNIENILANDDDISTDINKIQIPRKIKAKGRPKKRIAKPRKTIIDKINYADLKRKREIGKERSSDIGTTINHHPKKKQHIVKSEESNIPIPNIPKRRIKNVRCSTNQEDTLHILHAKVPYELYLEPNNTNSCFIDAPMEMLWSSILPYINLDSVSLLHTPYNVVDIMLRLSSHYHQKNTITGRSMATSIARRFAWGLSEFSDRQMNSAHYFVKQHLLSKASLTFKQNFFPTYTCSTICSSCGFKSTRENLLLDIDTVTSEITTEDPIEFTDQFYAHHVLNPRQAKCNSKDCAHRDATQENIITKYSPFLLIGAAMWKDPRSDIIQYTHFPYEMKFHDAHYILHSKVHSVTDDGFHFYTVATVEHNSERFLARFDNLKPNVEIITNRVSRTSQEVLCQPDKTTFVCYKLSTINKIRPTLMDTLEINESDAVLSPRLIGGRDGSLSQCYFCKKKLPTPFTKVIQDLHSKYSITERMQKYCQKYLLRRGPMSMKQREIINLHDTLGLSKQERDHFCWTHRFECDYKPVALEESYPLSIDFGELNNRIKDLKSQLDGIIAGTEDSFYLRQAIRSIEKLGSRKAQSMVQMLQESHEFSVGYYGNRGQVAIANALVSMYLKKLSGNIETYGLRPMSYIQQVLIPETGARLILEDIKEARRDNKLNEFDMMQVEHAGDQKLLEYARLRMKKSRVWGNNMYPET